MFEIFVDSRWVASRVLMHALFLAPLVYTWHLFIQSELYIWLFILGLSLCYIALIFAQLKLPLLKLDKGRIEICNFFYKGKRNCQIEDVVNITYEKKKIILHLKSERLIVDLIGMSSNNLQKNQKIVENELRGQPF
jgi:hypothetical protein